MGLGIGFLFLLSLAGITSAKNEIEEEFLSDDSGYHFRAEFTTSLCPDRVLDILYCFDHVRKYTFSSEDVNIVSEYENEYVVKVRFSRFFYSFNSVFRRKREGNAVVTELEEFTQRRALIPDVISSRGIYEVICRNGKGSIVKLTQDVRFNGSVNRIYMRMIQGGVKNFRESILKYIENAESR